MRARLALLLLLIAVLALSTLGPGAVLADGDDHPLYPLDTYPPTPNDNAVLQWNEEALECIRATRPGPTVAARALFMLHAAAFDAWAAYDARAVPTIRAGFTRRPSSQRTLANKTAAVGYAAHRALVYLAGNNPFQPCRPDLDQRLASMGLGLTEATSASPATNPGKDAKRAADNLVNARRNDGANQAGNYADTTGYHPVNTPDLVVDPWRWQPVRVPLGDPNGTPQTPATPQWGRVTPFDPKLLESAGQAPNPFNLSAQERSAMIDELVRFSAELDDRKKVIAEYWADGPRSELPPGHWNLFAQWVSRRWGQSIDADAKMLFGLNGAMLDASIAAWSHKYRYDLARPVSAIPALRAGQMVHAWAGPGLGTRLIRGEDWIPYQPVTFPTRRSRPTPPGTAPSAGPARPTSRTSGRYWAVTVTSSARP